MTEIIESNNGGEFHCGFVAIIGRPNVGKSTLLNRILGQKIAITSNRPQTTRNRILGIDSDDNSQILFIDTPGIHRARGKLHRFMLEQAHESIRDVDLVMLLTEADREPKSDEKQILAKLQECGKPVVLVINKIDLVAPPSLLALIDTWRQLYDFREIVPVSAESGNGLDVLRELVVPLLPVMPACYPADQVTDLPERFIVAEMIREKVMRMMRQEIPFGVAVQVEQFLEEPDMKKIEIHAVILVPREQHKKIIVGHRGAMIKKIGTSARIEIEKLLDFPVYLKLFVRVEKDWTESDRLLREFGYH
ncbi:MAG: GTPase Era [Desulfuromonas sp.]|nr:MAG: GTPase Era [Desulfuromonas sp.]